MRIKQEKELNQGLSTFEKAGDLQTKKNPPSHQGRTRDFHCKRRKPSFYFFAAAGLLAVVIVFDFVVGAGLGPFFTPAGDAFPLGAVGGLAGIFLI